MCRIPRHLCMWLGCQRQGPEFSALLAVPKTNQVHSPASYMVRLDLFP